MQPLVISTVPGGLLTIGQHAAQSTVEAFFYTMSEAQMIARDANPDPSTAIYFDSMTRELERLGWNEIKAAQFVHQPGGAAKTPLQVFAEAIVGFAHQCLPFVPFDPSAIQQGLSAVYSALRSAPLAARQVLDGWWAETETSVSVSGRFMTIGPLLDILGTPWALAAHTNISFSGRSWEALIIPSASFSLTVSPMVMFLNMIKYGQIEEELKRKLEETLRDGIRTVKLDLDVPAAGVG